MALVVDWSRRPAREGAPSKILTAFAVGCEKPEATFSRSVAVLFGRASSAKNRKSRFREAL